VCVCVCVCVRGHACAGGISLLAHILANVDTELHRI